MKKIYWLLAVIVVSLSFFQCQKDLSSVGGPDIGGSLTPDPINAGIQGTVTDENDQPAAGVMVTAGASTTMTDANGYFHFSTALLDKNTTLVTAVRDGYFTGYRVLAATSGCNQVAIKLIKKDLAGTVAASAGGDASLSNGATVSLPAGGVVVASSNADYTGDVKVYASYINPKAADIGRTIPGSLVANNKDGKRVVLTSYGMLAVELTSASGEKLQIKTGSVATLTVPIPSSSVASAPATVSLWYIDETTGIWQEEGTATKEGSNYVGTVKHFSYWNCDYQNTAVNVSFTLQTPDGEPLVNTYVEIWPNDALDSSSSYGYAHGYTDSLGQVKGLVPAGKNLKFMVFTSCYTTVYTQDISPITESTDLGVIKVTDVTSSLVTISGSLQDCNGNPVTNGYCIITLANVGTRYVSVDATDGHFSTTYFFCGGSGTITGTILGVDEATELQSSPITISVANSTVDLGTISACGTSAEQYIDYTIDGTAYHVTASQSDSSLYGNSDSLGTFIRGGSINTGNMITFETVGFSVGAFPMTYLYFMGNNYSTETSSTVTFTSFPAVIGDFYEGSMAATYITNPATDSAVTHSLSGTFKVRRNF